MSIELIPHEQAEQAIKKRIRTSRKITRLTAALAVSSGIAFGASENNSVEAVALDAAIGSALVAGGDEVSMRKKCKKIAKDYNGQKIGFEMGSVGWAGGRALLTYGLALGGNDLVQPDIHAVTTLAISAGYILFREYSVLSQLQEEYTSALNAPQVDN